MVFKKNYFSVKKWILAGGLSSENIENAIKISLAQRVDVNSGVEYSPGVKDHQKIKDFFIVRLPINTDFKKFENDYGLKKIDAT